MDELKIIASVLEIDPILFLKDEGTSLSNQRDNSTGKGNVIINEKAAINDLRKALDMFIDVVEKLTNSIKK